jgi:hypothetical protein
MKIKLELEDFRFATTRENAYGEARWLIVHIEGKPFCVWRQLTPQGGFRNPKEDEYIDRLLIEKMELMLRKVFVDACAAIPPGTELLDEEAR